ncbi:MAG: outer membrane protein assembly factor BamD [Pseudomonadota bacterium]
MQKQTLLRTPIRRLGLLMAVLTLALTGCSSNEERDTTRPAEELYAEAKASLDGRSFGTAIDRYRRLTTLYPFGRHAEQAQLDMAYALQQARRPEEALTTLDRFIRTYPTHPNIDYAWYLKGITHYDEAMGMLRRLFPGQVVDRDQESARLAFQDFQSLIQRYPQSRYVADARQRMVFLRNVLAEYEITVGEYYFRRKAYVAAISRAQYVIENYSGAPANVNALALLERSYQKMDLPELAADTRRVLELNYADQLLELEEEQPGWLSRLWPFD